MRSRLVAGVLGGAAGLLAMELVRRATSPLVKKWALAMPAHPPRNRSMSLIGTRHEAGESAPTRSAGSPTRRSPSPPEPQREAHAVVGVPRWGTGSSSARSTACSARNLVPLRDGLAFARVLAARRRARQLAFGLADRPAAYPIASHAQSLAEHVGYGSRSHRPRGSPISGSRPGWRLSSCDANAHANPAAAGRQRRTLQERVYSSLRGRDDRGAARAWRARPREPRARRRVERSRNTVLRAMARAELVTEGNRGPPRRAASCAASYPTRSRASSGSRATIAKRHSDQQAWARDRRYRRAVRRDPACGGRGVHRIGTPALDAFLPMRGVRTSRAYGSARRRRSCSHRDPAGVRALREAIARYVREDARRAVHGGPVHRSYLANDFEIFALSFRRPL